MVFFGQYITLSADGKTLIASNPQDNSGVGAIWNYTQANGYWTDQNKIINPTAGALGPVALSKAGDIMASVANNGQNLIIYT